MSEGAGIQEVIIGVGDVAEALRFYRDVCGFDHVRTEEQDGAEVVELDAGGQRVTLVAADEPGIRLVVAAGDLEQQRRRLRRRQVALHTDRPVEVPGGAWLEFADPWGNRVGFWRDDGSAARSEEPPGA